MGRAAIATSCRPLYAFAVALNCGMASSSLKADVKAFDRLRIVRDGNSSYFDSKIRHRPGLVLALKGWKFPPFSL